MKMRLKMKNRSLRYDINTPRPRHGHKYTRHEVSPFTDGTPKQHLKLIS